jgi:hypothetical protein
MESRSVDVQFSHVEDYDTVSRTRTCPEGAVPRWFRERCNGTPNQFRHPGNYVPKPNPLEEPVDISITLMEDREILEQLDHSVEPGDIITFWIGDTGIRLKYSNTSFVRYDRDDLLNGVQIAYAIDAWDTRKQAWRQVQVMSILDGRKRDEDIENLTLRQYIEDACGLKPEQELAELISSGLNPTEALDYWMVKIRKASEEEWADTRNCPQQTVSQNVRSASNHLQD